MKDSELGYYLRILLIRDGKKPKKLIECHYISEVAAYNLIKLYATIVASLEIKLEEEGYPWQQTGEK